MYNVKIRKAQHLKQDWQRTIVAQIRYFIWTYSLQEVKQNERRNNDNLYWKCCVGLMAQLGLHHLKIFQDPGKRCSKNTQLNSLTLNPGASWISSVGTVRSRIPASPNTSSTIGTARVKQWAMKWKWAVTRFLWPGWKFKPQLNSAGRKVASSCTDVITACASLTLHLLSASCFTFHLSWQSLHLNFCSSSMCLIPFCSVNGSNSKATGAMEGKMFLSQQELLDKLLLIHILCITHT